MTTTARSATRGDRWQTHIQHAVGGGIPDKVVDDALERGASLGDRGVVASANVELVVILCEVARSEASVARHKAVRTTRENE